MNQNFQLQKAISNDDQDCIMFEKPQKRFKHEESHFEFMKEIKGYKNSETYKEQNILYSLLFQLLINYGYQLKILPLDYIYLLKQKVEAILDQNKWKKNQRDFFYQEALDIQEFIELEQPITSGMMANLCHQTYLYLITHLDKIVDQFQIQNKKILIQINNNKFVKSNLKDENLIVKVCELLLNIADKCHYQQEIIQITEAIIQEYQIQKDKRNYLQVYICYITGNYYKAVQLMKEDGLDHIQRTPKYLVLQGLVYRFINPIQSRSFIYQAIEIAPNDFNAIFHSGINLIQEKCYQLAIIQFDKCLKINNKKAEIYFFKGICHFWINQADQLIETCKMFEYGLVLQPKFKIAKLFQYYALQKLNYRQDAQNIIEKLNQQHENYDRKMMDYAISVADKFKILIESYKNFQQNEQSRDLRHTQNLILILCFYQINCKDSENQQQISQRIQQKPPHKVEIKTERIQNQQFNGFNFPPYQFQRQMSGFSYQPYFYYEARQLICLNQSWFRPQ